MTQNTLHKILLVIFGITCILFVLYIGSLIVSLMNKPTPQTKSNTIRLIMEYAYIEGQKDLLEHGPAFTIDNDTLILKDHYPVWESGEGFILDPNKPLLEQ